jgi:hypothetical protein
MAPHRPSPSAPRAALLAIVLAALFTIDAAQTAAAAGDVVRLPAGCTAVALTWPAGTPLTTVAAAITPRTGLVSIWRSDPARGTPAGFAPGIGARADYAAVRARGERAVICMKVVGALTRPDAGVSGASRPSSSSLTFSVLPPGAALPGGDTCAARVRHTARESRPANTVANRTPGTAIFRISGVGAEGKARFAPRIDGRFAGTTDEIMQWAACKWGMDEDIVRAMAMQESAWRQPAVGKKATFGLLQIKRAAHPDTFPASRDSTAFNLDYGLAWWRSCFEGYITWIPASARGDTWGCVGLWFSGRWRDADAERYIALIKRHLAEQPWRQPGF